MQDPKHKIRLYEKSFERWGTDAQILKAIEELCELTLALLHTDQQHIFEEMADVEIMLEQLEIVFGCRDMVKLHKINKLRRLKERLNAPD